MRALAIKYQTSNLILHARREGILKICLIIRFAINSEWNIDENIYRLTDRN